MSTFESTCKAITDPKQADGGAGPGGGVGPGGQPLPTGTTTRKGTATSTK
jgi:hypothetical protein